MSAKRLKGVAASPGIAWGPAFCYTRPRLTIPRRDAAPAGEEYARFEGAREQARQELTAIRERLLARTGAREQAAIFDAHLMMLDDPMLEDALKERLSAGETVEAALRGAVEQIAASLRGMESELFAARAVDVVDVGERVLRLLLGLPDHSLTALARPSIIVARDLTPSDTAALDPSLVLGLCTSEGGLTAHTAILARTLNIPALVALGDDLLASVQDGLPLLLDGVKGELLVNPSAAERDAYEQARAERDRWLATVQRHAGEPACTANGRRVEVSANIGDASSARRAVEQGAEGVGLLRTEFLYLDRTEAPTEEQQLACYLEIVEALGNRPVIVRTLDIGGDKPPRYLNFPEEMNPFLGWRAIRICLEEPALFKSQLRAILRAGAGRNVLLMYPMISSVEEVRAANQLLAEAKRELAEAGLPHAENPPVGIMVETPAAAAMADVLAGEVDFFSIGSNDLTQYTLAVDRTNARVSRLYQPLHPAVLRLIKQTIEGAHRAGKWVGMCGELAGMPAAIPILLGLGLDEFSMAPGAIPEAKWWIRQFDDRESRRIARKALTMRTACEVEAYMRGVLEARRP